MCYVMFLEMRYKYLQFGELISKPLGTITQIKYEHNIYILWSETCECIRALFELGKLKNYPKTAD